MKAESSEVRRQSMRAAAQAALMLLFVACATSPAPSGSTPFEAEQLSFDGLQRVNSPRFAGVWIREGADFSVYRKLMLLPAEIAYKKAPVQSRESDAGFLLDEDQKQKLAEMARTVFLSELVGRGGWQIVGAPGPDVLLVQGGLIDLVVRVPQSESASTRAEPSVASYGAMTLVMQLYDSETRRVLARVVDRREVLPAKGSELSEASRPAELRTFFQEWAKRLREGLDAIRESPDALGGS